MPSQYHRPPNQPLLERRPTISSTVAPVAVMRQVPPIEIETQNSIPPTQKANALSQPSDLLRLGHRTPAYRGILLADTPQTKACDSNTIQHHSQHKPESDGKPFVMSVTTHHDSCHSFARVKKQLIVKFKLPPILVQYFQDDDVAKARLRAFSSHSSASDSSHLSWDLTSTPFQSYTGVGHVGFASAPSRNSQVPSTVGSATAFNGYHGNHVQTARPFVVADPTLGYINHVPTALQLQPTTMRAAHPTYRSPSSVLKNSIWSKTPISRTRLPTPRTTSAESSASSSTTASTVTSSADSVLSHITVAAPDNVRFGFVERHHHMGDVSSKEATPFADGVRDALLANKKRKASPHRKSSQPSTPVPAKRVRSDTRFPLKSAEPHDSDDSGNVPISQCKRREMRVAGGTIRQRPRLPMEDSEDEEVNPKPDVIAEVQEELRDGYRTRSHLHELNEFIGSLPPKKPNVEAEAWISRKQLLEVRPSDFQYPVALASLGNRGSLVDTSADMMGTQKDCGKGAWSVIDDERDLRDEIEKERDHQSKSSPKKSTSAAVSRASTEFQPPTTKTTNTSVLHGRLERVEQNFANELLFIQAISNQCRPPKRAAQDLKEVERAADVWLGCFRRARARFEAVCQKQGLFASTYEVEESTEQEYNAPEELTDEIEARVVKAPKQEERPKEAGKKEAIIIDLLDSDIE